MRALSEEEIEAVTSYASAFIRYVASRGAHDVPVPPATDPADDYNYVRSFAVVSHVRMALGEKPLT